MIDISSLEGVPNVKDAVEAHAFAERAVVLSPELALGDRTTFLAIFTLLAWAKAGGSNVALIQALERAAARAPDDRAGRGKDT